jgi:solute:Na+ symporter, SSS family
MAPVTLAAEPLAAGALTDRQVEISVFVGLLGLMLVIAFMASRWRKPKNPNSLEEWGVGGRAFGNWVTWFLIGGASYTAYTFIAIPAYSWGYGAIGFYAVPFALITTPLVFLVSTRFWSVAHAHGFVTSAEFTRARFGSRPLALVVAVVGIVATLPYIAVQLIALEAVFKVTGIGGGNAELPLLASLVVVSVATFRSGLRAPALLSIAKDILLVWLVLSVVLVVAMSGGWGNTFDAAQRRFGADQSPATDLLLSGPGQWTYLTLVIGSALSIFAYPHALTGILAAKDRNTIKRNAAALPIYIFALGLMAMLGLFAIAKGVFPVDANLSKGFIGDTNTITPMIFHNLFPSWSAGIAYATLAVAALIPASIMSISAANLFTRSIYMEYFRPRATPIEEARVSRWVSLFVKFGAAGVIIWLNPAFSTEFQLTGSILILQILPAVFIGVMTGWFHRWALMIGMIVGLGMSVVLLYYTPQLSPTTGKVIKEHFGGSSWPLEKWGIDTKISVYIGLITMLANLLVVLLVTALLKLFHISPNLDHTRPEDYTADADIEGLDRLDQLLDGIPQKTGAHALR